MNDEPTLAKVQLTDGLGLLPITRHDHPEPQTMVWSELELQAIRAYAGQCVAAERTRIALAWDDDRERPMVDDGQGARMDALLLRAKDMVCASQPTQDCVGGYAVPAAEWLALQDEVMHRLREHAREGFIAVLKPNPQMSEPPKAVCSIGR